MEPRPTTFKPRALTMTPDASAAASFVALYEQHYRPLYAYFFYRTADSALSEDLAAQTFERACVRFERYDPARAPFAAWLFAIAHNLLANHWRRQSLARWLPLDWIRERPGEDPPPEERLVFREQERSLLAALAKLPERERSVIALKFAGRLTNGQIAEITGLSVSNVGVVLFRALKRLKVELGESEVRDE